VDLSFSVCCDPACTLSHLAGVEPSGILLDRFPAKLVWGSRHPCHFLPACALSFSPFYLSLIFGHFSHISFVKHLQWHFRSPTNGIYSFSQAAAVQRLQAVSSEWGSQFSDTTEGEAE
jgi:hypothetical protein